MGCERAQRMYSDYGKQGPFPPHPLNPHADALSRINSMSQMVAKTSDEQLILVASPSSRMYKHF